MADIPVPSLPDVTPAPTDRQMVVQDDDQLGLTPAVSAAVVDGKVSKSGDTMTGPLSVPDLTANGNIRLNNDTPILSLYETDGTADERLYQIYANNNAFVIRQSTDAGVSVSELIRYNRSTGELQLTGNTSVSVPDATADGEALAYDQPNASLKNLVISGTTDSLITFDHDAVSTKGIDWKDENGVLRLRLARFDSTNELQFRQYDATGVSLRQPLKMAEDGEVDMSDATSVSVPDLTATGEVTIDAPTGTSQLTLKNAAAGDNLSQIMFQTSGGSDQHAIVHTDGAELRLERAGVEYFKVGQAGDIDMSDAPSVTVPDATADGEALAYGQAGAELRQGLTLDYPASRWVKFTDEGVERWRLNVSSSHLLSFDRRDASGVYVGTSLSITEDGDLNMAGATSVSVPAAADGDTNTAAQTTGFDSTTGQVQVNGAEVGDTGERDVTSTLTAPAGATTFQALLRRTGNTAHLRVAIAGATDPSPDLLVGNLWSGFRGDYENTIRHGTQDWASDTGAHLYHLGSQSLLVRSLTTSYSRFDLTWVCTDAWPATLPGTPA